MLFRIHPITGPEACRVYILMDLAEQERLMAAIGLLPMLRLRARPQVKGGAAAVPISNPPAESS